MQELVPVLVLYLHARLALRYVGSQCLDVAVGGHARSIDLRAERLLDETLQLYHVEGVEGQVGLYVVGGTQLNLLLCLDVSLDDVVFLKGRFCHGGLGSRLEGLAGQDVLQLVTLQFLQFGTGQVLAIDEETHQLLVVRHREVVWFQHLTLEDFLHLIVAEPLGPFPDGNDNGTQEVAILYHGRLLHAVCVFLQFVFYLGGLHVLSVGEHDNLLAASRDVDASLVIDTT